MEIAFETELLRSICENAEIAKDKLGDEMASVLQDSLADLVSIESINEFVWGKSAVSTADSSILTIELAEGVVMVLKANHIKIPIMANGDINWDLISRVKIIQIGNHE